jgi:hypothetical protein
MSASSYSAYEENIHERNENTLRSIRTASTVSVSCTYRVVSIGVSSPPWRFQAVPERSRDPVDQEEWGKDLKEKKNQRTQRRVCLKESGTVVPEQLKQHQRWIANLMEVAPFKR